MTDCAICGRTLDATETEYSTRTQLAPGGAYKIVCADCLLRVPKYTNER
jgi:hypothetical protein